MAEHHLYNKKKYKRNPPPFPLLTTFCYLHFTMRNKKMTESLSSRQPSPPN